MARRSSHVLLGRKPLQIRADAEVVKSAREACRRCRGETRPDNAGERIFVREAVKGVLNACCQLNAFKDFISSLEVDSDLRAGLNWQAATALRRIVIRIIEVAFEELTPIIDTGQTAERTDKVIEGQIAANRWRVVFQLARTAKRQWARLNSVRDPSLWCRSS